MPHLRRAMLNATPEVDKVQPIAQRRQKFFKTKMCKFYALGACNRGRDCVYAHTRSEVQQLPDFYKTQLCTHFMFVGSCENGENCRYAHSSSELRSPPEKPMEASTLGQDLPREQDHLPSPNPAGQDQRVGIVPCFAFAMCMEPTIVMATPCLPMQAFQADRVTMDIPLSTRQTAPVFDQSFKHVTEECTFPGQHATFRSDVPSGSICEEDPNGEPVLENCGESQEFWSRQSTAEGCATLQSFSRQTTESSPAEQQLGHDWDTPCSLSVKNTFLEWQPDCYSAATRSRSAGGRIEAKRAQVP